MTGPALIGRFRDVRLALVWGAAWGAALGGWLIAPRLLSLHRLAPQTVFEWTVLEAGLFVSFALTGALLNVIACLPVVAWRGIRRRDLHHPTAAFALATPPLLAAVYLGWSAIFEWLALRGLSVTPSYYQRFLVLFVGTGIAWGLVAALFHRRLRALPRRRAAAFIVAPVTGLVLSGVLSLPARTPAGPSRHVPPSTPVPLDVSQPRPPVLLVGLDGGNWRTLRPLLESGRAPTLARLAGNGVTGNVEAPWPPHWSAAAWAAIATGHLREQTGIFEDLALLVPGLPAFHAPLVLDLVLNPILSIELLLARAGAIRLVLPPREMLRRAPFWELLSRAGAKTAVVRFGFTHPAPGRADVVVSDWVGTDAWSMVGLDLRAPPDHLAAPRAEAAKLLDAFRDGPGPSLSRFVSNPDHPPQRDTAIDPLAMLRIAATIDSRTLAATRGILRRHPDVALLAVYLGGLDNVMHSFWQYRFPEDFPADSPDPADVAALGPVTDRYLEWLDEELAALAGAFPTAPNVVVISDHGYEAIHHHTLWKGWHAADGGIFLASGPSIPRRDETLRVSYLDVAPTIFRLAGFAPPPDLPGKPLF